MDDQKGENVEDDLSDSEILGTQYIDNGSKILNMYPSRNKGGLGYLAIISEMRFAIYYLYEDSASSCEIFKSWDLNYRFDKKYSKYGQHLCIEFDENCTNMVSSSASGHLFLWDITNHKMEKKLKMPLDQDNQPFRANMIRDIDLSRIIVCYSFSTQQLLIIKNKMERNVFHFGEGLDVMFDIVYTSSSN